jgi:hypothetical protein
MFSYVIMIDLTTLQDKSINFLQSSHSLLPIPNLSIHPFHLVIVMVTLRSNVVNMSSSWPFVCIDFSVKCSVKVRCTIANQSVMSSSRYFLTLAEQRCNICSILRLFYPLIYPETSLIIHQCLTNLLFYLY